MSTKIQWTEETWNPVRGCSRISPGCQHCYAETIAARFSYPGGPFHLFADKSKTGSTWTGKVELIESKLLEPLSWREPRRVFVNSMSDLFHEALLEQDIDRVFGVMAMSPVHTFQVLTKRSSRLLRWINTPSRYDIIAMRWNYGDGARLKGLLNSSADRVAGFWPFRNIWMGVSVESRTYKFRIDDLRAVPAAVRFLSIEPLLEDIGELDLTGIHWVIIGGESGLGARVCELQWIRRIINQCRTQKVACFVKQLGARPADTASPQFVTEYEREQWMRAGWTRVITEDGEFFTQHPRLKDRKGGDPAEWAAEFRVREYPEVANG